MLCFHICYFYWFGFLLFTFYFLLFTFYSLYVRRKYAVFDSSRVCPPRHPESCSKLSQCSKRIRIFMVNRFNWLLACILLSFIFLKYCSCSSGRLARWLFSSIRDLAAIPAESSNKLSHRIKRMRIFIFIFLYILVSKSFNHDKSMMAWVMDSQLQ